MIFTCLVLLGLLALPVAASAQSVDELQKAALAATDRATQAKLYKQLGDAFVAQDQLEQAADAFTKALAGGRENFSTNERVQIAIYLSWADRLSESADELRQILVKDPKSVPARTHLARMLSWSGDLREAIREADLVLAELPDHKDALLVKADSLQWQGRFRDAIPIYEKILAREDDFDARAGLTRCRLALGNRTAALENFKALKPTNTRQKRELAKLSDALDQETRPTIETRYNYYHDSDKNRLNRYLLAGNFWLDNQKYGINYRHTDADDPSRDNRAEEFLFKVYSRLTDQFSAGGGLGFTQLNDGHTSNFPTGFFRIDSKLFAGSAGAQVTRDVLTDTAELIDNRIRVTQVGLYLAQPLTERFTVSGAFNYKSFSDGNHANDLQFVSQYTIYLAPRITIGHRFRFLDFNEQSHSGFFDPNNYIANRAFGSLYYENRFFYTYIEGYIGYENFRRNDTVSKNVIHGGTSSLGVKPLANLSIEVNVEGGNFSAGSAAGFNYFTVGPRVLYRF